MRSEGIPLEQGLRHSFLQCVSVCPLVRGYSIRTGIKTLFSFFKISFISSEGIPLEQGLRQHIILFKVCIKMSEGIPLEQGLRHSDYQGRHSRLFRQRVFH